MPPLKSVSGVIQATTPEEFNWEIDSFERGDNSYVLAKAGDATFHLFTRPGMDYRLAIFGLMLDGITCSTVKGEYFPDYDTYLERNDSVPTFENSSLKPAVSTPERQKSKAAVLIGKILGR